MSNDTHEQPNENKTIISFRNSFWLVVILVGLFIGALNFVQSVGEGEEGEGKGKTEMKKNNEAAGEKKETKTEAARPAADEAPKGEGAGAGN